MLSLGGDLLLMLAEMWLDTATVLLLSAVCRQLRDILREANITVDLTMRRVPGSDITLLLPRFRDFALVWPRVATLEMYIDVERSFYNQDNIVLGRHRKDSPRDTLEVLPFLHQLRTLCLAGIDLCCSNRGEHSDYISELVKEHSSTLREIGVSDSSPDLGQLELALGRCSNLHTLTFCNIGATDELIRSLQRCTNLTRLELTCCRTVTCDSYRGLAKLPRLQVLTAAICDSIDEFGPTDAKAFRTLREARLFLPGDGGDRARTWAACPQLTHLHITQDRLSREGLQAIAANTNLVGLEMSGSKEWLRDVDFSELQGAHLRRLALRGTCFPITTVKITNLVAACAHLTHLILELSPTKGHPRPLLTKECGSALAGLRQLRILELPLNNDDEAVCLQGLCHSRSLVALQLMMKWNTSRSIDLRPAFMLPAWTALQCVSVVDCRRPEECECTSVSCAEQVLMSEHGRHVRFCQLCPILELDRGYERPMWAGLFA